MVDESSWEKVADNLFGSITQVKWANQQINDFSKSLAPASSWFINLVEKRVDLERNEMVFVPVNQPVVVRDHFARIASILNSLYSALDYLAYRLVITSGNSGINERNIYFPIRDTEQQFIKALAEGQIKHVSDEAKSILTGLNPYKDGNFELWLLNHLNNQVKHRELITIQPIYYVQDSDQPLAIPLLDFPVMPLKPDDYDGNNITTRTAEVLLPSPMHEEPNIVGMIKKIAPDDGQKEIYRVEVRSREPYIKFGVDVVFENPEVIKGWRVMPTLRKLSSSVANAIERFNHLF